MRNALILIAVLALVAIACMALVPVTITDADNGKIIDVLRYRTIKLTLRSTPSTGYMWKLVSPEDRRVIRSYYSAYRPALTKMVGVAGHEEWKFRAIAPGTATIKTIYMRSWEGSKSAVKSFTVTIRVR